MNPVLARCASTFQAIITEANPEAAPAWVNYFLPQNQAKGYPVAIGGDAYLAANGATGPCELTFQDPTLKAVGTAYFMPGHTTFDGSSAAPVYAPAEGNQPTPNVQIAAYGNLTYLNDGSPVAGTSAANSAPAAPTAPSTQSSAPTASSPTSTSPTTPSTSPRSGFAPTIDEGPVPDQKQCGATVSTDLSGGSCALAEKVFSAVADAYDQNGKHVPATVSVTDPDTGKTDTFSCQILTMAQEVACGNRTTAGATFSLSAL